MTSETRRWLMLPVILLASFMASFDYMVVNVATPSLRADLHAGQAALELIVAGYAFTYAAGMVTGGRLGDLFGHRRLFLTGMAAFTVASLLCGLADSPGRLVAFRLLQGLGAALMVPQVMALITVIYPIEERPRALSWFGVTLGLGSIAGQVCGGLLLSADLFGLGWRVIFLVNGPVGVAALAAAARLLPRADTTRRPRLDLPGAAGISAAVALALIPLALGREAGWPLWTYVALGLSVPVLAATLWWERRTAEPLLDLALFRSRAFSAGLGFNIAQIFTFSSFMFILTLLLQAGLGLSTLEAGLVFVPGGITTMIMSLIGRRLVARYGRAALVAGALITVLGPLSEAVLLAAYGDRVSPLALTVPMGLFGLGSGLALPSVIGFVMSGIRPDEAGAASGVLSTSQQFAGALGVAALGAVFFAQAHPGAAGFAAAAQTTAWLQTGLLAAGAGLTLLLPHPPKPAPQPTVRREPALDRRL
jgi:EmrB/QacA subfamily drug resistance transporter